MGQRATILVVNDDPAIRRLLRATLKEAAYAVVAVGSAAEAIVELNRAPDIVLLDLDLPDRDGLSLLPIIAASCRAGVLVVSDRDNVCDKVTALDRGAVDYVTNPFDPPELLARIRAALRSRIAVEAGSVVIAGHVSIDLVRRRVVSAGNDVHLTPKEYGVLAELARYPGRAITHQHLLRTVWPNDRRGHVGYLRLVIRSMRQKLEMDPARPRLIVNEMGVGYRLREGFA